MSLELDTLYQIAPRGHRNDQRSPLILIIGTTVSVNIYGAVRTPAAIANMADLNNGDALVVSGSYNIPQLPEFIAFTGTLTGGDETIDLVGYEVVKDLGAIS